MSAHTKPSPVATEKADTGRRIRATIAAALLGGVDDGLAESEDFDDVLVGLEDSDDVLVEQPDAATAMPTPTAATSRKDIRAFT